MYYDLYVWREVHHHAVLTGLTRSAAYESQILGDLPESIIAVEGARFVKRDPKRLGDCARYRADELAVTLAI